MFHLIDDFYPDPDEIRRRALTLEYKDGQKKGLPVNHPGARAINPWYSNLVYLRNRFETITGKKAIEFEYGWSNGAFNVGYKKNHLFNWVHGDHTKKLSRDYMTVIASIYLAAFQEVSIGNYSDTWKVCN